MHLAVCFQEVKLPHREGGSTSVTSDADDAAPELLSSLTEGSPGARSSQVTLKMYQTPKS